MSQCQVRRKEKIRRKGQTYFEESSVQGQYFTEKGGNLVSRSRQENELFNDLFPYCVLTTDSQSQISDDIPGDH